MLRGGLFFARTDNRYQIGKNLLLCMCVLSSLLFFLPEVLQLHQTTHTARQVFPFQSVADAASDTGREHRQQREATEPQLQGHGAPYVLGVYPHFSPRLIETIYAPLAAGFSRVLDHPVQLRTSSSFEKFSANLDTQAYDIVLVQPFDYVRIADTLGYVPLARLREPLVAVFAVRIDSQLHSLLDFRGKTLAAPPSSAAVSRLAWQTLHAAGLDPQLDVNWRYVSEHNACIQHMILGKVEACITSTEALTFIDTQTPAEYRIVAQTPPLPHVLFAAHPRLSQQHRALLTQTLLGLADSAAGHALLEQIGVAPLLPATDAEYDVVRRSSQVSVAERGSQRNGANAQ